ncbi:protocatechuate 3,4-dioxygenase, alpha subunit [Pseudonocardia thermophila]|jgi:protocatechuate 3,4-dioxygenase, alpha subunit|uniref:Protocatechuate 3,4-dioxygenase, alpha subunit n=1 Tax=Pseudonocardia thermophila TaxID=1848 RepID=A0A1M7B4Y7_PSETH|nr:protocatechuate 3,4-dioxygenase subunit alpha [Pseudonocardia thermophila]SHL50043.1 protocatechuate 3,4-dioxygenase, alpha subunit [Pseudonocardia thermophila]
MPELTPSQTVGPYLALGLTWPDGHLVVPEDAPGAIVVHGVVTDGAGEPVPDAVVETWQADADGRFDHPEDPRGGSGFRGFGRCLTAPDGSWRVVSVKPGAIGDGQAPHIDVSVLARGLLDRVVTRIYFPDEQAANAADPLLATVPQERRSTLLAVPDGPGRFRFDIRLQGEGETVFLAV